MLASGLVAGCGSDDEHGSPIPATAAAELEKRLDSVQGRFDFGGPACADIAKDQPLAGQTIAELPEDVDPDVRQALQDGFDRLFALTDEQCDETKGQETETEPQPEPDPVPETETEPETDTETIPTETIPTETVPTLPEEPPIEPVPPEDEPSDEDGGNGGAIVPEDNG